MSKVGRVILVVVIFTLIVVALKGCSTYNKMVRLDEEAKKEWANVENVYQRRADLIPNLIGTIKGSSNFEQSTLQGVIEARAKATSVNIDANNLSEEKMAQFQAAQGELNTALSRLLVTIERYPELKTTEQFRAMNDELAGTENRIANERRNYNAAVQKYNAYIRSFPQTVFARIFGFTGKAQFTADPEANKRPVVDFS